MWIAVFHEKSNLEKNYDFLKIPNFSKFTIFVKTPEIGDPSTKIPRNLCHHKTQKCKNIRVSRNSRAEIQIFPGKFLSKFRVFTKIRGRHFHEFPGILVDKTPKNARIYGFPGMLELKGRFFPGNFHQKLEFSRHFGATRHEIPGNFGRHDPRKCRNIWISRLFGGKNHNFPGNFGRRVARSRKMSSYPRRAPSRIYGFPGPPRRTF